MKIHLNLFAVPKLLLFSCENSRGDRLETIKYLWQYPIKLARQAEENPFFEKIQKGNPIIKSGFYILDEDLGEIAEDFHSFLSGELKESAFRFSIPCTSIKPDTLSINPVQYLPKHNAAFQKILQLGELDTFEIHRLGDIASVYNGPRFKRPYAEFGVTDGPSIRKYYTGTALTQLNSDNIKYLDSSKADKQTERHLDSLTIHKGYILISDSGTLGRVSYALNQHEGHVATNNLIRVVVEDECLRGYIYQFLKSEIGQCLMLKNAYGTNQEHLEPDVISEIPIPVPKSKKTIEKIGSKVLESIEELEKSISAKNAADSILNSLISQ